MVRDLSGGEIDTLLSREVFGHLGCVDGKRPYVVPMAFVFHDNVIYGQTSEGKKVEMLRRNPLVCFQVEKKGTYGWESAMCFGTFEELDFGELEKPESVEIVRLLTKRIGGIQDGVNDNYFRWGLYVGYAFR